MGAWVTYGLGSESADLPGFVVLSSGKGTSAGSRTGAAGFCPRAIRAFHSEDRGDPILYLSNPDGISRETQRARLDVLRDLKEHALTGAGDPKSPPVLIHTNWHFECRWRPRVAEHSR